ncbi:MAG: hypothetical protein V8S94_06525 [Methanobrevibacter smithii]
MDFVSYSVNSRQHSSVRKWIKFKADKETRSFSKLPVLSKMSLDFLNKI